MHLYDEVASSSIEYPLREKDSQFDEECFVFLCLNLLDGLVELLELGFTIVIGLHHD